jgi:hypothetical protein
MARPVPEAVCVSDLGAAVVGAARTTALNDEIVMITPRPVGTDFLC